MSEAELKIEISSDGEITTALLDGPADSATFDYFKEQLTPLFSEKGGKILLDFTALTYINSSTMGWLLNHSRKLVTSDGGMYICNANPMIARSLEVLGIAKWLPMRETREEALKALQT